MTRIASFAVVCLILAGLTTHVSGEDKPKDAGKTDLAKIQGDVDHDRNGNRWTCARS